MMKYSFFILSILLLALFSSCGGSDSSSEGADDENANGSDSLVADSLAGDSLFDGLIYTACGAVDGPDEYLWVHTPGEWNGDVAEDLPEFEMLHVIPYEDWGSDLFYSMTAVINDDFKIFGGLGERDVPVIFWYNRDKTVKAVEYNLKNKEADGTVTLYFPNGDIFIQREYDKGRWTKSIVAPYSADWKFVQSASELWIKDPGPYIQDEDGNAVYSLMPTVQEEGPGDNSLNKILEKESYQKQFQINDQVFTGVLKGYYTPADVDSDPLQFVLHFVDGWLHGDVKIYNYWGELALHEIFVEGELDSTVFELDYGDMDGMAKPIIYIYPEEEMQIDVRLTLNGHMTHSYPAYERGWKVTAQPDGTLTTDEGKEYYALYWEGENAEEFIIDEGFVIPGSQTASFLEESLEILGLNRREAMEFIVFWLPILEDNPYNLIHFSSQQYAEIAQLKITPEPETSIRVMMVYQPLDAAINIPLQDLNKLKKTRKGYTVVEWGGSLLQAKETVSSTE